MRFSVIGCGYFGVVYVMVMVLFGYEVVGIDVDENWIVMFVLGKVLFFEFGFDDFFGQVCDCGMLMFLIDFVVVFEVIVYFIVVGIFQSVDGDGVDLCYVDSVIVFFMVVFFFGDFVVGKFMVLVGMVWCVVDVICFIGVWLVWNLEFFCEGFVIQDILVLDCFVYGVESDDVFVGDVVVFDEIYWLVIEFGILCVVIDYVIVEFVKVLVNVFLVMKILFINVMVEIVEVIGVDVIQFVDVIGFDVWIGCWFFNVGIGFGGGCLLKDIWVFVVCVEEFGVGEFVWFLYEVDVINLCCW